MKLEIKIPEIAENVDTGLVAGVLVTKGEQIRKDQPLIEVETDKATTEIPSPYEGTVDEIKVEEGDEVKVDQVIMVLEGEGDQEDQAGRDASENEQEAAESGDESEAAESGDEPEAAESEDKREAAESGDEKETAEQREEDQKQAEDKQEQAVQGDDKTASTGKGDAGSGEEKASADVPAAPSVRRQARESGVDLRKVKGTGPGGRITAEDVESYTGVPDETKSSDSDQWGPATRESLSNIRKLTAERMKESWQQIPHVTQFDECDITGLEQFRQANKDQYAAKGGKLTVTSILLKVVAMALQRFPRFNASLDEKNEELVFKHYYHIGVAVDTDRGLLVPVIRDVDRKSLRELTIELDEIAEKARQKKISPEALQGGNFTVSNLGGIGGTAFTPIVYSPQVAILGVSRSASRQVYRDGEFEKRLILPLSLSYDHRVIDGAEGARFLRWICQVLEEPFGFLH